MKTVKLFPAFATFSLVLFMSVTSLAYSGGSNTGVLTKSGNNNLAIPATSEKDFSYLRFDVNKYMNENESVEVIDASLDYLKFDVNDYVTESETEVTELPVANEFEYLRFDVDNYTDYSSDEMIELPVNEFDYLRFDVNNFETPALGELPVAE